MAQRHAPGSQPSCSRIRSNHCPCRIRAATVDDDRKGCPSSPRAHPHRARLSFPVAGCGLRALLTLFLFTSPPTMGFPLEESPVLCIRDANASEIHHVLRRLSQPPAITVRRLPACTTHPRPPHPRGLRLSPCCPAHCLYLPQLAPPSGFSSRASRCPGRVLFTPLATTIATKKRSHIAT